MARARKVSELSCGEAYAHAAAKVVAVRAEELIEHSEGVLDITEIERLHAMRVASRRLRAAMEIFEPCFPGKRFRAALGEVKEIADALGERRDRDVSILALEEFGEKVTAPDRRGIQVLVGRLREEQSVANEALVPLVDGERLAALKRRIDQLGEAARGTGAEPEPAAKPEPAEVAW